MKRNWHRDPRTLRHAVMLFFFLFLLVIAYDHQTRGGGPRGTPSVEAYCPFGGVENLYYFIVSGGYIRRIEPSSMVLLLAVVLLTLVASRGFCGWLCPFGAVQEWIGMIGKRIFKKRYNPTGRWDRALRYLKYVILVVVIALTWHTGTLVFRAYDPFLAFFHLGKGVDEMPTAYALLGVVLGGSLIIERFFCKYACPLGAVLGVIGKFGLTKVERTEDGCKGCNLCQKKCFAHIDFLSVTQIRDAECNHCLDCVVHCPKPNILAMKGPKMKFSHPAYAALLVAGLFGTVFASQMAGKWRTKPNEVSLNDWRGRPNPENIRGWMTFEDVSKGFNVPVDDLYSWTGVPRRVPANARLNTIAKDYNVTFEPDELRGMVRGFLDGKPPAAKQPKAGAGKGSDQKKKEHDGGAEPEVKGFMTLNEIALKTGVPKDWLLKELKLSATIDPRKPIREWMHDQGKSVGDLRQAVEKYRKSQGR